MWRSIIIPDWYSVNLVILKDSMHTDVLGQCTGAIHLVARTGLD